MEWKKANVVPIHTKNDKQCINIYRPVSLLPTCNKIFGRLLFNELYKFLNENDLLSSNQSGFQPGDSCTNQLLSITHEMYQSSDNDLEVRRVFLDISKAFDKVWLGMKANSKIKPKWYVWKPVASFKRFFKIPKTKGGIKWSKLFLERNLFRCSTRTYFGTSLVLDLSMTYRMAWSQITNCLHITRPFSLLFMMSL